MTKMYQAEVLSYLKGLTWVAIDKPQEKEEDARSIGRTYWGNHSFAKEWRVVEVEVP